MVARFVSTRPPSVALVAEEEAAASAVAVATTLVVEVEGTAVVVAMVGLTFLIHDLILISRYRRWWRWV